MIKVPHSYRDVWNAAVTVLRATIWRRLDQSKVADHVDHVDHALDGFGARH